MHKPILCIFKTCIFRTIKLWEGVKNTKFRVAVTSGEEGRRMFLRLD